MKKAMKKASSKTTELKAHNAKNQFTRAILWHFGKGGKMPEKWNETLAFFDGRCAYCGSKDSIVKDHAIPANRKCLGTNQHGNFVPACKACNQTKGDKHFEAYRCKRNLH